MKQFEPEMSRGKMSQWRERSEGEESKQQVTTQHTEKRWDEDATIIPSN